MSNDTTEWKDVPGYEGYYQVSNNGLVKRVKATLQRPADSLVINYRQNTGYIYVYLQRGHGAKRVHCRVHRLVMMAFRGECPPGMHVNHIDGDKANNHIDNLEYVTPSENSYHAYRVLGYH